MQVSRGYVIGLGVHMHTNDAYKCVYEIQQTSDQIYPKFVTMDFFLTINSASNWQKSSGDSVVLLILQHLSHLIIRHF